MLQYTFGITSEQYETLLQKQNHCCAICKRHETEFAKKLAVDHDHQTQAIRGLLCWGCNRRVIGKHRDSTLFKNAAAYLEQEQTGFFVPIRKKKGRRRRA
jgi:hypothetical protein